MRTEVTDFQKWKRAHAKPAEGWLYAWESIARTNVEFCFRMMFVWPRVILRIGS